MQYERKTTRVRKRGLSRNVLGIAAVLLPVLCLAQGPPTYYITTVAGTGGSSGFSGDDGLATSAQLSSPTGIAVDAAGTLYIADQVNNRIREVLQQNSL